MHPLISTEALAARLGAPDLRVVDASWHLDGRDARAAWRQARIPGAVFFDLDAVSDPDTDLPHMLPPPQRFAEAMGALGMAADDHVVVYDAQGLFSAARAWWSLKAMGVTRVQVLDGGLPKWRAEGRPLESGPAPAPPPALFRPAFRPEAVAGLEDVRRMLTEGSAQVADARPAARFRGEAPEPRPGLRSGHMPGAVSLPFPELLNPDGTMKDASGLRAAFAAAGVDPERPVTATCGSGVTAAIVVLALAVLGHEAAVYDGSWAEWGGRDDTAVAAGP